MSEDYCDLCDLPRSTCVHGMPPAPRVEPAAPAAPAPRKRAASTRSTSTRSTTPRATAKAAPPVRRTPRRWSPPELFAPHIVAVLQEAGGQLDGDVVFERLEARIGEHLLAGDSETTPEGELRWRRAARVARRNLTNDGLIATGTPGVWQLTASGLSHTTFLD